jgi:O-antigen/teichoic acid export membrane protein
MAGTRRALVYATVTRYITWAVTLGSTPIIARLMTPTEAAIAVIGGSVFGIAMAVREVGSVAYLVQQEDLSLEKIRTVFTVSILVTCIATLPLVLLSGVIERFYDAPGLARYTQVVSLAFALGPLTHPIYALLTRDMAFRTLALMDVLTTILNTTATLTMVILGSSYMSFAWAGVISSSAWLIMGFCVRRDLTIYRPSLSEWRGVLSFGAYGSVTAVVYRISESLQYLILGRFLDLHAVAIWQRAYGLAIFPETVILAGIGAVALPAFSDTARRRQDLKGSYLRSVEHITAVQWPALILLAIFAEPIVRIILGSQWTEVVVPLRILAIALLFDFPTTINYPAQVAAKGIRHTVPLAVVHAGVTLGVSAFAARYGMLALAMSTLVSIPVNVFLSVLLVRALIPFRWSEFVAATQRSAASTISTAAGPLLVVILYGGAETLPMVAVALGIGFSAVGWISGLWLVRHPFLGELQHVWSIIVGRMTSVRIRARRQAET